MLASKFTLGLNFQLMKKYKLILTILIASTAFSAASAQEDCAKIEDNAQRLECYDLIYNQKAQKEVINLPSTANAKKANKSSNPKKIEDKSEHNPQKENGFLNKAFGLAKKYQTPAEKEQMFDSIKAIKVMANGRLNLELTNSGHVWQTKDTNEQIRRIKGLKISEFDRVAITEAVLSGYTLKIPGKDGEIRVTRIR